MKNYNDIHLWREGQGSDNWFCSFGTSLDDTYSMCSFSFKTNELKELVRIYQLTKFALKEKEDNSSGYIDLKLSGVQFEIEIESEECVHINFLPLPGESWVFICTNIRTAALFSEAFKEAMNDDVWDVNLSFSKSDYHISAHSVEQSFTKKYLTVK